MKNLSLRAAGALGLALVLTSAVVAQTPAMLDTKNAATQAGWDVETIFTVSDTFNGYQPVGILDGTAAYPAGPNRILVLVNHELNPGNGYSYSLANGTQLTGARVSAMVIERSGDGNPVVVNAQVAYDRIYDRQGQLVVSAAQVNETGNGIDGFSRFCSSQGIRANTFGFEDDLYFTGEETGKPFHPHGGTEWVVDVQNRTIWAAPALGRGAWENVTPIDTGNPNTVGILLGDDSASAPLYLYIGQKNAIGNGSFLDRNGLLVGQLYAWKADNGDLDPQTFNTEGSARTGTFVPVTVRDQSMAGQPGYDAFGYADIDTLQNEADSLGCFSFSRPEDLHTNPANGMQVVFASTGRGQLFPADNWGTTYVIDMSFAGGTPTATLTIVHDADGLATPDEGIRSPDNLVWADDGFIYIQEDRSTSPSSLFGAATGIEASIWRLDVNNGNAIQRIATVDRSVVRPAGSTDIGAGSIGNWETSGVLDVTSLLPTRQGETLLLATVQAHGIRNGPIGDNPLLDEGGQLVFLKRNASMMRGDTANTLRGWKTEPIFTVSDTFNGYQPVGILDGVAAYPTSLPNVGTVLVNHELSPGNGYAYTLANGTTLTGARVSRFEIRRDAAGSRVLTAGPAYNTIIDRQGNIVTSAAQVNETGNGIDGFARFCSSQGVRAGTFGFVDNLYFTGEETGKPFHPHGGTEWVLDVDNRVIHAAPALGRGAWENVTPVETGDPNTVGILLGDDSASAPLYLYIGQKNALGNGSFLDRNGLAVGQLYAWRADSGDLDPQTFNGNGAVRTGTFVAVTARDQAQAGQPGYDAFGYADIDTLQGEADSLGCFSFSRPEDLHTNPANGMQVAFASTGRGQLFPADNWGTTYVIDMSFAGGTPTATLTIVHDADDIPTPDAGIRSPDNLVWATDGFIYIQEDRSTSPSSLFGAVTGAEASLWQLEPTTGAIRRVLEIERSVVLPLGSTDIGAGSIGNWESSGILDVSDIWATRPGERLLIGTVQAHGIRNGLIGDNPLLDEGGQLLFITKEGISSQIDVTDTSSGSTIDIRVLNGTPGNDYLTAYAFANPNFAPNGWFFGIELTINEFFAQITAPYFGTLDANGEASYSISVPGVAAPIGLIGETVVVEFGAGGTVSQVSEARSFGL